MIIVGGDRNDIYSQEWTEETNMQVEIAEGEDRYGNTMNGRVSDVEKKVAREMRDNIAMAMWKDYEQTLGNRKAKKRRV